MFTRANASAAALVDSAYELVRCERRGGPGCLVVRACRALERAGAGAGGGVKPAGEQRGGLLSLNSRGQRLVLLAARAFATNARSEYPKERPLTPQDMLATIYRHLGIDPSQEFPDTTGRPIPILRDGQPIAELV